MKLKRFKETNTRKIGVFIFTIVCVLLVSGVIFYRTFAVFEVKTNQNVINGTVQDPGNLYFAFYVDNIIQKEMPNKDSGYVLDEVESYCGVNGVKDESIEVYLTEDWFVHVGNMKTSRTKCNLYFVKGNFFNSKGIPVVEAGDGLYAVEHTDSELDDEWKKTEYRYAGANPNNYVWFNEELWRIIGFVNVKTSDGHVEQRVKIIRNESIGEYSWDAKLAGTGSSISNDGSNDWTDSQLMQLLNGIYYNSTSGKCYNNKEATPKDCNFITTGIKEETRKSNLIAEDIIWNIGGWNSVEVFTNQIYNYERGDNVYTNTALKWSRPFEWKAENTRNANGEIDKSLFHSIAIPYPSDLGYSTSNRECLLKNTLNQYAICMSNSWFITQFFLTPYSNGSTRIYGFAPAGQLSNTYAAYGAPPIYPVLYLKKDVKITRGNGTKERSFQIM